MFEQILQLVKEHMDSNPQLTKIFRQTRQMRCTEKLRRISLMVSSLRPQRREQEQDYYHNLKIV